MRLIMMGTGPFAVPTFQQLLETRHVVVALVTRPPHGRGGRPPARNPMREVAEARGLPILDPENLNAPDAQAAVAGYAVDLLVVCDYGQILAPATLSTARLGGINLHASLLPKYRGAAPINWALYRGEIETGVSVIHMTPRIDAGPVIAQERTAIGADETAVGLESRLAEIGAGLTCRTIDELESGRVEAIPQDAALASRAPRLKKNDGLVDWNRPAMAIKNQVRAMEPWPKCYAYWHRPDGPPMRLILGAVEVVELPPPGSAAGTVLEAEKDRLVVAAGQQAVLLRALQPAGKRLLPTREFLNGHHIRPGDHFGAGPE
jgi:methionyl-tRNA formyltransferase